MAVSAFQKVVNKLFQQFIRHWGREPQTPKEWMDLQNEAVRYFNLTKGKGVTGAVRTSTGDVRPIPDPFIGFKPNFTGCSQRSVRVPRTQTKST